ncbi:hemolysin family protein [Exiguobacterium sp. s193]|uniref:hemolysin family protein n=1 Tax=Exiguobacterium sp. s193 TaxID=2751207 RepID=UPI001BEAAFD0|nr:hemolysin family protein [Exiguobacterium sp. s193]
MDTILFINLFLVVLLIVLTAFFVGSEFAVVKVRMSRLDQMIQEGNKSAILAKKIAGDLDYYLSACQLGITVTALGLGALGEPTVEKILHPVFDEFGVSAAVSTLLSFGIAFISVTFLHVVIGELAPKTLAIQYAEKMTLLFARPLFIFGKIMYPFIWLLNGSARFFLGLFGVKPAGHEQAHSEDELKIIMAQSFQSGEINQTELALMQNVFAFDEHVVKDLMVPRMRMATISERLSKAELMEIFMDNPFTRYPVTEENDKDRILGYINVKEVLTDFANGHQYPVTHYLKDLPVVSETTSLQDTLRKMKETRSHIVLVVDEYGGTAGIVSMEDLLEEIVGEIRDEFDTDEVEEIQELPNNEYLVAGTVLLEDLEERFGLKFTNDEDVDTIGGWIQMHNIDLQPGEHIDTETFSVEVMEMENYQINQIKLWLHPLEKAE